MSSESSTNIQCGRIWRLWRICFTWRGTMDAAEAAKLQIDVGLDLGRPGKSPAFGKQAGGLGDQRRGWADIPSLMALSSRRRHGVFQYQVFAHSQAQVQGAHYLFFGSPNNEKAPLPHRGMQRVVRAEVRARGPGPVSALAGPAAPWPAACDWECGCAPRGRAVAVPHDSCPHGNPEKEETGRQRVGILT